MEVSGQLYPRKNSPRYTLDRRRLGWSQNRPERCGVETYLLPLPGIVPPPSRLWPVAIPTELSQLHVGKWKHP
jgi:hypothetical protein